MFKLHTEPSNYVFELIFVVNIKFLRASYHTIESSTEELYCLNRFYRVLFIVFYEYVDQIG